MVRVWLLGPSVIRRKVSRAGTAVDLSSLEMNQNSYGIIESTYRRKKDEYLLHSTMYIYIYSHDDDYQIAHLTAGHIAASVLVKRFSEKLAPIQIPGGWSLADDRSGTTPRSYIENVLLHLFPAATAIVISTGFHQLHTSGRERFANGTFHGDPGHLLCLVITDRISRKHPG